MTSRSVPKNKAIVLAPTLHHSLTRSRGWRGFAALCALAAMSLPSFGLTVGDGLDAPSISWQASAAWEGTLSDAAHDGVDAVTAAAPVDQLEQRLSTTVFGPGTFSLWWRIAAGGDGGDFIVEVDGHAVLKRSSAPFPWEQVSVNVPPGTHTIAVLLRPAVPLVIAMVDQAEWLPGQRLPVAEALGDPAGLWVQTGAWEQVAGASRDGIGTAARLQTSGGAGSFRLVRLLNKPAVGKYWRKIETFTPGLYRDLGDLPLTSSWVQVPLTGGGQPGQSGLLDLTITAAVEAGPATLWLDDLEVTPLSLGAAVDLADFAPVFTVSSGSSPWQTIPDEADTQPD